jgi:chromatin remodeling complex protein RSC6
VHTVISQCYRILGIVVAIDFFYTLKTTNDIDSFVQLRNKKLDSIKTVWKLDMSNFTHGIEVCFGAINDVERSIFAYVIIQNENVIDL